MRSSVWQRRGPLLAGVLLTLAGLGLTTLLADNQRVANETVATARFSEEVRGAVTAINQRIAAYTEIVNSARNMFLVDPQLKLAQFNAVAQAHDFRSRYPELRNLSFARWKTTAQLPAFEAELLIQSRHTGHHHPQPIIHPAVNGNDHYIIQYLWPYEHNEGVFGLDIASQPANKTAVERGRATGQASLSAPLDLIQETTLPRAVLLRVPVFIPNIPTATRPQQPEQPHSPATDRQFIGSATVTIRIIEMLETLHAEGYFSKIALRLDDMGTPETRLVEPVFMGEDANFADLRAAKPYREAKQLLDLHGRRWQLSVLPAQPMLSAAERQLPYWITGAGATLSLLLGLLAGWLLRQRSQALSLADRSLQELQHSETQLQAMFDQAAVGVSLTQAETGRYVRVNQKLCELLGYEETELLQKNAQTLTLPEDRAADRLWTERLQRGEINTWRQEKRLTRKDGQALWTELAISVIRQREAAADLFMTVIQDISQRRQMQEALRHSEQRLRSLLDHLPVGILMLADDQTFIFRNRSFVQMTGYTKELLHDAADWWQLAYPDEQQRERVKAHWQILMEKASLHEDRRISRAEYEIHKADGSACSVAISGVLLEQGNMVIIEDLSQHKAAEQEIRQLSAFDPLTGLANRRQLIARIEHALAASVKNSGVSALLMLDLDHFKTLNETRGHHYGDMLLCQVVERLRGAIPQNTLLARHGDDEFVLLLENLSETTSDAQSRTRELAERILAVLRAPFVLDGLPCHTTASLGAVLFHGHGETVDELLQWVDLAMVQAKLQGRDQLQFYDPQLQTRARLRAVRELDLRQAIDAGQFQLYYQPQVADETIFGAEVLLRWHRPQEGYISPGEFIPLAEETGLILPLGQWVLEQACTQLSRWQADPLLGQLTLAVNISVRQFHQSDFVAKVLAALAGAAAPTRQLELELTESLLLQDVEDTIAKMHQLKAYGLEFSLDDFGTGYSSLSYLKRLPLDQLKIDQSFVRDILIDPNDATIARTIVALAHSLGLRVIAEGVETPAQRDFLQQHGCNHWQGYLYSKPLPVAAFEALVRQQSAEP